MFGRPPARGRHDWNFSATNWNRCGHFDPLTQISREEILTATIPPAGELGILKQWQVTGNKWHENSAASERQNPVTRHVSLATLLDYLPRETIFLLCEPDQLAARAEEYASQIPASDPFFISWEKFLTDLDRRGLTRLELNDADQIGNRRHRPGLFQIWR